MTSAKQKNLAAVVAVSLLYLIYLLNRFSAIGTVITAGTITYLVVRNCVTIKGNKYGIIDYLGQYFGASVCNCLLVALFSTGITFKGLKLYGIESGAFWAVLIITIIAVFVLEKLHTESKKNKIVAYIAKYTCLGVGAFFLYRVFVNWLEPTYIYVLIIYIAITIFIEQIYNKNCNKENSNSAFYWCMANVVLFAVIEYLYPAQSIEIMDKFTNIAVAQWKWYTIALIAIAALAVGIYSWIVDSGDKVYPNDKKLCLVVGIDMLIVPYMLSTYTKYSFVLLIAFAILNIVIFFGKCKNGKYFKISDYSFAKLDSIFVIGSIILAVLHRGFLNGWMYSAIIFFSGLVCSFLLYRYKTGANGWLFWEFIVIALAGYTCEVVYRSYNSVISYRYIIFVVLLTALALAIMNVKNKKRYTGNIGIKLVVIGFAALMIYFPVKNFGVEYKIVVDDKIAQSDKALAETVGESNNITVRLKARGKENTVSRCYYYWNNDTTNTVEVTLDDKMEFVIPPQNGSIHIYSEDEYGVSSVATKWFDFKNMREWKYSGEPKYLGSPFGGEQQVEEAAPTE